MNAAARAPELRVRQDFARLGSARAEMAWVNEKIAGGLGKPYLAITHYSAPAVIYRRKLEDEAAMERRAAQEGCDLLARRVGGGAVFAGPWMLGVDLLLPVDHPLVAGGHTAAFRWFGDCWQAALRRLAVPTTLADAAGIAAHNAAAQAAGLDWACFAGLSHGELLDRQGGKLVGLAQSRGPWGVLLSAGLLLSETPWERLEFICRGQYPEWSEMRRQASAGLASLVHGITMERLTGSLMPSLEEDLATGWMESRSAIVTEAA
jgi:lipoate-protein ligase A